MATAPHVNGFSWFAILRQQCYQGLRKNPREAHVQKIYEEIYQKWDEDILPQIEDYIRIPNKSPMFDREWEKNGYMDQAVNLVTEWCRAQKVAGMHMEVLKEPGRTPLIIITVPGIGTRNVLLYGHIDKQPEMTGWDDNKGPWIPVREGDKLYGRGGADDGYAVFSALTAIATLQKHGIEHSPCQIIVEASEESSSEDLPFYLEKHRDKLNSPDLVICLDSGCGNWETLWSTTSLRGVVVGDLELSILNEGIHSGTGSGAVPSWFDVASQLIGRLQDPVTGFARLGALKVEIPKQNVEQAKVAADLLGEALTDSFGFAAGVQSPRSEPFQLLLARTWRAAVSVTGADGLPPVANAGNVCLPKVTLKLSVRLPPTLDSAKATQAIKEALEVDPIHGVRAEFKNYDHASGWKAPAVAPWLHEAMTETAQEVYGKPAAYWGEGGSIPFMGMLGKSFPDAQFLITGVLGPKSNAHGPNEFLHIPMAKKVTASVASMLARHRQYRN